MRRDRPATAGASALVARLTESVRRGNLQPHMVGAESVQQSARIEYFAGRKSARIFLRPGNDT